MRLFTPPKFSRVYLAHWLKDPRNSTTPCCFPIHHTIDVSGCSPHGNFPVVYLAHWLKDPGTALFHAAFPFIIPATWATVHPQKFPPGFTWWTGWRLRKRSRNVHGEPDLHATSSSRQTGAAER